MKLSKIGLILGLLYGVSAFLIALRDLNCGGGLDINICGLGTVFVTFPSYLTVGRLRSSSLVYDPATDEYTYVWKTDSSWIGNCRQLVLQLNDGSVHRANFKFK